MHIKYVLLLLITLAGIGILMFFYTQNANAPKERHEDEAVEKYEIYPGIVAEKIKNGEDIILLDVRTLEEYAEVHLENSILLPVQELSQQTLDKIGLGENSKDKEIIIYCRSGARSKTAYDIMNSLGYTNIKSIAGGMIHWQEDEYPFTEAGEYINTIQSSGDEKSTDGPRVRLDRTIHDFGVVPQYGGVVNAIFAIYNDGADILKIGDITTSCSCTSATISSNAIAPGDKAELIVKFDPDFHEEPLGVFKRTVFIPTNDPNMPEVEIVIQVDIAEKE